MSNWEGENIAMKKVILHPDWDFAVVVLKKATTLDVTFPQLNRDDLYPSIGANSRTMGWGDTVENGTQSDVLLEVDVPIISNEACDQCYGGNGTVLTSEICAFNPGFDACRGDSGECFNLHCLIDPLD
jgi:trypsin